MASRIKVRCAECGKKWAVSPAVTRLSMSWCLRSNYSMDFRGKLREYIRSWRDAYLTDGCWDESAHIPAHGHDRPSLYREAQ